MKSLHYHPVLFLALFLMISFSSCTQEAEEKKDTKTVEKDSQDRPCPPPVESEISYDMVQTWRNNKDSLMASSPDQFGIWPDYFQVDMALFKSQIDTLLHTHFRIYYGMLCSDQNSAVVLLSTSLPIDCNSILHTALDSVLVLLPVGTDINSCGISEPTIKICFDSAISWTNRWRTFNDISKDADLRTVDETTYKIPLAFNFNYIQFCSVLDTSNSTLVVEPGLMKVDTTFNLYEYKLMLDDDLEAPTDANYLDFASPCPRHCGGYKDPLLLGVAD